MWSYPRGQGLKNDTSAGTIAYAARQALELLRGDVDPTDGLDVGRLVEVTAGIAQITPAEVVYEKEDDIRRGLAVCEARCQE